MRGPNLHAELNALVRVWAKSNEKLQSLVKMQTHRTEKLSPFL